MIETMDDLISRAAAIEAAIDGADDWDGGCNPTREEYIMEHMAKVPAVDAVPVVRCSECKYRLDSIQCSMYSEGMNTPDNWFCADGERRDDECQG